jgi:hypothetical protein
MLPPRLSNHTRTGSRSGNRTSEAQNLGNIVITILYQEVLHLDFAGTSCLEVQVRASVKIETCVAWMRITVASSSMVRF